jgi:hypothetical protein
MSALLYPRGGSTLFVTLSTLTALSLLAAYTLQRVTPKFHEAYQTAAWQEARLAAEAGVDAAMGDLIRNAAGPAPGTWNGWKQNSGGIVGPVLAGALNTVNSLLSLLSGSVTVSQPVFLDNLKVSAASGIPTEVDVQLWALQPSASPQRRWFRIRSMATCALPAAAYKAPGKLDSSLRRLTLRNRRPQLKKDDVGAASTLPTPSASRIIEVLVEPILPFELAVWTNESLSLGTSGSWGVDSYDSRDPAKSNPDGTYPGRTSPKVQENGSVASNGGRPATSLYGPLIAANGARVRGVVATHGGDDPTTDAHENVAGSAALDSARIRDDFCREMNPVARPTGGLPLLPRLWGGAFPAGTESIPARYTVSGTLGGFRVAPRPAGQKGAIIIMVNGDLDVRDEDIVIPPNVTAQLYVRGNIDFHNHMINAGDGSSRRPGQLQIYGEDSGLQRRTLRAFGASAICAAFYGPTYEVQLQGAIEWCGAIAARSFEMLGGDNGGFHYDEALGLLGPPISFRIARYVEDVRE